MTANSPIRPAEVYLQIQPSPDRDDLELTELAALLRADLLDLDLAAVEPVYPNQAPEGSKGPVAAVAGWLSVNLGREALRAVANRVAAWASRSNSTVELTLGGDVLILRGVTSEQQNRLIDVFVAKHGSGG